MPYPRIIVNNQIDAAVANIQELELDLSFNEFSPNPNFVEDFMPEFVCSEDKNDAINLIDRWSADGYFGQKIPCRIEFGQFFNVEGFLDLGSDESVYSYNPKIYKIKFETAQRAFFDAAKVPLSKFVDRSCIVYTRYVRRGVPDYLESLLISVTIFLIARELIASIQRTIQTVKDAIPQVAGTAIDIGTVIRTLFNVLIEVIYQVSLLLALNALLKDLSENIFAKPRKFKALDVYNTISKGCEYLGYSFDSEFFRVRFPNLTYAHAFTLGEDSRGNPEPKGKVIKEPTNNPIPDITLLEFIEKFTPLNNGKIRVTTDKKVLLETRLIFEANPIDVRLSNLYNIGDRRYKHKQAPLFITYEYLTSEENQHIKDNKASLEYSLNYTDKDLSISNSIRVNLPYSVATRKNSQDSLEKFFNGIFDLFAGLNANYKVKGGDRKGFVLFNSDILPVDLIYIRDGEKINKELNTRLDASNRIMESYRSEGIDQNQWVEYSGQDKDPLCDQSTVSQLIDNNVCYNNNGEKIIVQKNIYDPKSGLYDISYMQRVEAGQFGYIPPSDVKIKLISDVRGTHIEQIIPTE